MSGRFMGVDLHKKYCVFTELDSQGNITRRGKFSNNQGEISDFASSLTSNTKLTVEPVLNYLWFLDQVKPYVKSVHPAHPQKVRVIAEAKNKTDKYDSHMLAELLRTNFLPESYYVPEDIRRLRDLVRQRSHLVGTVVAFKCRVRHLLLLNGSKITAADVSAPKALKQLKSLCLPDTIKNAIYQCLGIIKELNKKIKELETELENNCPDNEAIALLDTIPGIGILRASIIYAEIGDINRFKSKKAFCSYTGLVPIVRESGEKRYTGSITKAGSRSLRTALIEAAINACVKSAHLHRLHKRLEYRGNKYKARTAVAHRLAMIIYVMLKKREPFRC